MRRYPLVGIVRRRVGIETGHCHLSDLRLVFHLSNLLVFFCEFSQVEEANQPTMRKETKNRGTELAS